MTGTNDRFKDAPWFKFASGLTVIVGGAGGISSWLTLFLSRAMINCIVFDDDVFEHHNLGGQFMRNDQIGLKKVDALANNISQFTAQSMTRMARKYDESSLSSRMMLSGFDNMMARRIMFDNWKREYSDNKQAILIDGRLLFEQIHIFCVTPETMDIYEREYLFSDEEVEKLACTTTQTSHTAALTAAMMTAFLTNHITNIMAGKTVRTVPFTYEMFIPMVYQELKLINL